MNTVLPQKANKTKAAMPRKCRERQKAIFREHICGMPQLNKSGNAAKEFAAIPRKIDMRKCRAAMPHSSVTLRYYRANTCFCLLFSHPLRMLYTSPKPHFVDAKAPSSPSTCTSSFPRAASPRHPGCRVLSVKNADTLPSEFST